MLIYIIIFIALSALIFLLFSSVSFNFSFRRREGKNSTEFLIKYLFINKKIAVEKKDKTKKTENKKTDKQGKNDLAENGIRYYLDLYKEIKDDVFGILNYITRKTGVFESIKIRVDFGFSDVSKTGIMTGTLNGILYNIMSYFHNNYTVRDWEISVNPDFDNEKFDVFFDCIVKLKTVHIINIAFKGLKIFNIMRKTTKKKGRKANGKSN